MKKLNLILSAYILGTALGCASSWDQHDDQILTSLSSEKILTTKITAQKSMHNSDFEPGSTSNSLRILFLQDEKGQSFVIKESSRSGDFEREQKHFQTGQFSAWQKIISDYEKEHKVQLPHLVDYIGFATLKTDTEPSYLTCMRQAPGTPIKKLFDQIRQAKLGEKEAKDFAQELGQQMGHLTRAFFLKNQSFLTHGDLSENNIIFDPQTKTFTWIDLGRISTRKYLNKAQKTQFFEYGSYLEDESHAVTTLWFRFFPFHHTNDFISHWDGTNHVPYKSLPQIKQTDILKSYRTRVQSGIVFYNAYYQQVQNLEPAKEYLDPDLKYMTLVQTIQRLEQDYRDQIIKAVGEKDTLKILTFLFDPKNPDKKETEKETKTKMVSSSSSSTEKPEKDLKQVQHQFNLYMAELSSQVADILHAKLLDQAKKTGKNPFDTIFARFGYNKGSLTAFSTYSENLLALDNKFLQESLKTITDGIVQAQQTNIKTLVQQFTQKIQTDFVEHVKDQLCLKVWTRLYMETLKTLESLKQGKIRSIH